MITSLFLSDFKSVFVCHFTGKISSFEFYPKTVFFKCKWRISRSSIVHVQTLEGSIEGKMTLKTHQLKIAACKRNLGRGRVQTETENTPPVPVASRLSLGPITPSRKKQQITETFISQLNECYLGSSTTTCQTPDDEFIRWDDGGMTGTRPIRKEACTLIRSFANPKKMLRIGNWNVRTMNCSWRSGKMEKYLTTGDVGWSFVSLRRQISWNVEIGEE